MSAPKPRVCLGCGGIGCSMGRNYHTGPCDRCQACLGSGLIQPDPEGQGVRDAMADAETLRFNADDAKTTSERRRLSKVWSALTDAGQWGYLARSSRSDHAAVMAARAAFRAVPALRGEQ